MTGMRNKNGLAFSVIVQTSVGDKVFVVGNLDALGSWLPSAACELSTSSDTYPRWSGVAVLPGDCAENCKGLEFKFVVLQRDGSLLWEPGENRTLQTSQILRNHVMETTMFGQSTCNNASGLSPQDPAAKNIAGDMCSITTSSSFSTQSSHHSSPGLLELESSTVADSTQRLLPVDLGSLAGHGSSVSFPSPTSMSSPHCITPYSKVYGVHPALFDFNSQGEMVMKVNPGSTATADSEEASSPPRLLMRRRKSSPLFVATADSPKTNSPPQVLMQRRESSTLLAHI